MGENPCIRDASRRIQDELPYVHLSTGSATTKSIPFYTTSLFSPPSFHVSWNGSAPPVPNLNHSSTALSAAFPQSNDSPPSDVVDSDEEDGGGSMKIRKFRFVGEMKPEEIALRRKTL